jgi:hypothetical protein
MNVQTNAVRGRIHIVLRSVANSAPRPIVPSVLPRESERQERVSYVKPLRPSLDRVPSRVVREERLDGVEESQEVVCKGFGANRPSIPIGGLLVAVRKPIRDRIGNDLLCRGVPVALFGLHSCSEAVYRVLNAVTPAGIDELFDVAQVSVRCSAGANREIQQLFGRAAHCPLHVAGRGGDTDVPEARTGSAAEVVHSVVRKGLVTDIPVLAFEVDVQRLALLGLQLGLVNV